MSAQRTEKSLDSHHLVVDKRETPRADDFHVTGNTNVTQPEGDAEPLSVLSRSHNPQPETHLTSASRRKLGSRRRNKQQQHVKDSATDLHHKPREELEENTKGNEALETTQPERQDQLHNQSEHESSVTRDSSLCSPTKSGYSGVVRDSAKNTEDNQEIQILKSGNQQADRDEKQSYGRGLVETTLEVSGAAAILQSEDGKEDIACSSDLISSLSATENEKRREEDTDLLRQDGNVEGNCLKGEADVKTLDAGFSAAPEATTDKNNPTQNTEIADDNQNDQFSLHLDSQTPDVSVSTKERSDANFSRSVNRGKMGSSRRNKRPQHVKDSVPESEKEPVENVGFGAFEPETFSALTETDVQVKSEETVLGGANMPDTDGTERKEFGHVADMSESNTSSFLPTPSVSEPLINQSNDREMPFDLPSVFSATNAERKERDEDTDLLEQWTSLHSTDLVNESHVKSDYLECPMKVEASTEDHGEHREPECCVESAIDSSPNEQLSTNEEPNKHFSLTEVRAARNLHEEEFKPAEMQEMHLIDHSFVGANSEICFSNPTDQAEVGDSSQSDSSVKGVAEQGVSKPDYKQDTHPAKPSDVKAFTQMKEDCQVYAARKPEAGDIERVDTAVVQVYENEGQLEDDIKPSTEQTSHQEKEGVPSEATGSKSPPGTLESETQPQGASGITDQSNTDFHPFSNRRKLGSSRRNNRHNKVETPGVESEMSLMQDTEVQGISMQLMLEGRDKVGPSQTEEVCDDNKENAHSSNFGLTSIHSSSPVEQQVTEQPNSPVSAYSAVTETESKEKEGDTDLLTRWGILQADDTVNETHTQSESVESSSKPEKSSYREHTESKCGVEQVAVPSPKEEMSTMEGQNEHFSSFEVRGAQQSEETVEEEEVKPIHTQTTHQIDNSSVEEGKPCVQTLESETNSPLDSQPVDDSVSIKEETHSDFKLTGSRRKLGSSRRMKRRQHGPEVTEPEEEAGENAEKEKIATGTKSQEELKEQTSPDFKLTRKIRSEEQGNTEQRPEEDTSQSLNMMDNRTTDILKSTEEVNEAEDFTKEPVCSTPLPVHDGAKLDLIQSVDDNSDSQNISNHDDDVSIKSVPCEELHQEENPQFQNTEYLPSDEKDSVGQVMFVQLTTHVNDFEGGVALNEAESLMGARGSGGVNMEEEEDKDPADKDHSAQGTNTSTEVTHDEPFSVARNKTETFQTGHEENTRAKPSENCGISPAADAPHSRMDETSSQHNDEQELLNSSSDPQTTERNTVPNRDESMALLPGQSALHYEGLINPVTFALAADAGRGEVDVNVNVEPTQQDDLRSTEMQTASLVIGRKSQSVNLLLPPNTEDAVSTDSGVTEATRDDNQSPEAVKSGPMQDRPLESVEAPSVLVADSQPVDDSVSIKEETHSDFKLKGSRRKLGSSRRMKRRQNGPEITEPEEEAGENAENEKIATGTKSQEELKEQTSPDFKLTRKIRSEEQGNTEQRPEEDTSQSLNMMDNRTTDILKSTEDVNEAEENFTKEPVCSTPLPVHGGAKLDLIQSVDDNSDSQNISNHDDDVSIKSVPCEDLHQEENPQFQNTEYLPSDEKDSVGQVMFVQLTTHVNDFEGGVALNEAESLMGARGSGGVNMEEEEHKDPADKDHSAQGTNTSTEVTHDEPFSVARNKTETFQTGHEENTRAKPSENCGISPAADAPHSRMDETSSEHNDEQELLNSSSDPQTTERNTVPNRDGSMALLPGQSALHYEGLINPVTFALAADAGRGEVDVNVNVEPTQQDDLRSTEMQTASLVIGRKSQSVNLLLPPNTEDAVCTDSGVTEATQDDNQSPEAVKSGPMQDRPLESVEAPSVLVADQEMEESVTQEENNPHTTNFEVKDSSPHVGSPNRRRKMGSTRRNLGSRSKVENSHQKQTHTQSESVESSSKPEKSSYREHTESKCGVEQVAVPSPKEEMSTMEGQNEHFSSFEVRGAQQSEEAVEEEEVKPIHTQTTHQIDNSSVEERKPCVQTLESETNSPLDSQPVDDSVSIKEETHSDFKLTGSRRKLGSSRRMKRRQHGPEVTEPEEEAGENAEKEKIATGPKSQEELKEQTSPDFKLTVELSGSQLKTLAQQTLEENPDSPAQSETEHRLTPDYLPAKLPPPQKHDVASESSASGGRRRKMGSSRKSHGHEKYEDTTASAQKETDAKGLTDESVSRTSQRPTEEPLGSAEKPEVDEIVRKSSPNINDSDAPQPSRPLSGKAPGRGTPVQHHNAEIHLRQESHTKFSLAEDSRGADIRSKGYHVILVGDSNVGKSSLIKRAHSGKFSLDIPASVGLDSCMWTVVVDGNPVVLQLWDTAGQERFRSVTRQVFHKAQAFLLMYDITSYESFSGVSYWANCIQEGAAEDVIILLLGNKSDCGERQVNTEEADILAKEYNFEFMECSAATGDNVTHSLETVARMLLEKVATSEEAVALHRAPLKKERSGCC